MATPIPRLRIDPALSFVPASFISADDENEEESVPNTPDDAESNLDDRPSHEHREYGFKHKNTAYDDDESGAEDDDDEDAKENRVQDGVQDDDEELDENYELYKRQRDQPKAEEQKRPPQRFVIDYDEDKMLVVLNTRCTTYYMHDDEEELQFELEF